jgi:uncharacterized membrane protein
MRTVDMVRRDIEVEARTCLELEQALTVLEMLRYDVSIIPDDYHKWERTRERLKEQRAKLDRLNAELMQYENR